MDKRKDLQHESLNMVRISDQNVKRAIRRVVEGSGVYCSQHQLLMTIGSGHGYSQKQLAEKMQISPAAVAVSLNKLEKGGYITRGNVENDGRVNSLIVTNAGTYIIDSSKQKFDEMEDSVFFDFKDEELRALCHLLNKLTNNLTAYAKKGITDETV